MYYSPSDATHLGQRERELALIRHAFLADPHKELVTAVHRHTGLGAQELRAVSKISSSINVFSGASK
jgi:hypothetical protein